MPLSPGIHLNTLTRSGKAPVLAVAYTAYYYSSRILQNTHRLSSLSCLRQKLWSKLQAASGTLCFGKNSLVYISALLISSTDKRLKFIQKNELNILAKTAPTAIRDRATAVM